MLKAISTTIRYWFRIIISSIYATFRFDMVRTSIKDALVYGLIFLALTYLSAKRLEEAGLIENLRLNSQTALLAFGIFMILGLIFNLLHLPAKMYDEMGGFVKPPLKLSPDSMSRGYVSLKVENETPYDVIDCTLQLADVFHIHTGESVLRRVENLTWSSREHYDGPGNKPKLITKENPRWCDVAEAHPSANQAAFTLWPPGKPQVVGAGKFLVTISTRGRWQGKSFTDEQVFMLQYNNGDDIQLFRETIIK